MFKLARPTGDAPRRAMVELPGGGFALVELTGVVDGDAKKVDAAARDGVREQLARAVAVTERDSFLEALRRSTKIRIAEERM